MEIEIRHDEILDAAGVEHWSQWLADGLRTAGNARLGRAVSTPAAEISLRA